VLEFGLLALGSCLHRHDADLLAVAVQHLRALLIQTALILLIFLQTSHELVEVSALPKLGLLQLGVFHSEKTFAGFFVEAFFLDLAFVQYLLLIQKFALLNLVCLALKHLLVCTLLLLELLDALTLAIDLFLPLLLLEDLLNHACLLLLNDNLKILLVLFCVLLFLFFDGLLLGARNFLGCIQLNKHRLDSLEFLLADNLFHLQLLFNVAAHMDFLKLILLDFHLALDVFGLDLLN